MEQIVVKTEVQSNGEILLYYVDENGDNQEGVLTTIENIENDSVQLQDNSYMLESYEDLVDDPPPMQAHVEELPDSWSDEDTKRLLIFYNDNKTSFVSGTTQKRHLWAVACKTMLIGKNQHFCEEKLAELKGKYCEVRGYIDKGVYVKWPFLDLCHQAFHDDASVIEALNDKNSQCNLQAELKSKIAVLKQETVTEKDGILSIKQMNSRSPDEQVEQMLNLYLKYKESFQKEHWRRDLWDKIAKEMGRDDSEYLQKRFLNHKQHYITMLLKRKELGPSSVTWPYMEIFDKIFGDDAHFHKKHFNTVPETLVEHSVPEHEWNITQKTVLVKYYFDCYDEFEDVTIPNKFLWTEVGRLIEKKPETCQTRYEMLHREHLEKYVAGDYNLRKRKPIDIIFDHIIVRDVKTKLCQSEYLGPESDDLWKMDQIDELVQFFHNNTELFKDQICHFVCWAAIAHKLKKCIESCKHQWDTLVVLYNSILDEKKENPDMQIDWRYIELFDRIFDYGMDSELLKGYDSSQPKITNTVGKVTVKQVNIRQDEKKSRENVEDKTSSKEDPDYIQNINQPRTDPRSAKILEHYLKNKDKFLHVKNKLSLWDSLAKQIGMNSTQCAHRFRTLKQTYIEYVQKEIDKPRVPITWPYYALCKKVFGYRQIKNKLKQGKLDTDNDDWLAREIKLLISFFSKNFHEISNNVEDVSKWAPLASEIKKSETNCKEKFVELRKCYRKLKTMRARNPDVKISWSYFNMFDRIYSIKDGESMEVENLEEEHLEMEGVEGEDGGDDDYECIIVLQEDQEEDHVVINDPGLINNTELIQQLTNLPQQENKSYSVQNSKWTKRAKKRLLIFYINYIRSHRGKEIIHKDMWTAIAAKIPNKTAADCRKMFLKMKNSFKQADEVVKKKSPFSFLLEKILKLKPKFVKSERERQEKIYKDVQMASDKVNLALQYYLEHIEEFVNPVFEKKYLWNQLANHISEPVSKVYNKVNYLKQAYNIETEEIAGEKTEFSALLKEIIAKEVAVKIILEVNLSPDYNDHESTWTDDETEQLMLWYLSCLDKFKNPKFNRSYLWLEASGLLNKSPLVCSKKMSEIRTQYRNMVRENADGLQDWRFFGLCQKIYGTGKKINPVDL